MPPVSYSIIWRCYHATDNYAEEEKKLLAPLLGKIHVSPASSEDKIRALYDEVCIAVEDKLVVDATGRNALYKLHVSLGKIVNSLGQKQAKKTSLGERGSETPEADVTAVAEEENADDKTVLTAEQDEVDDEDEEEETLLQEQLKNEGASVELSMLGETSVLATRPKRNQQARDSLVEELLSDDEL